MRDASCHFSFNDRVPHQLFEAPSLPIDRSIGSLHACERRETGCLSGGNPARCAMTARPNPPRILVDAMLLRERGSVSRRLPPRRGGQGGEQHADAGARHPLVEWVCVSDAFDAADDWIAEEAGAKDVVITGDILLADRALKAGGDVLAHNGSRSPTPASARRSRRGRSWPICGSAPTPSRVARRRSPRRIGRGFCNARRGAGTAGAIGWDQTGAGMAARRRIAAGRSVTLRGVDRGVVTFITFETFAARIHRPAIQPPPASPRR